MIIDKIDWVGLPSNTNVIPVLSPSHLRRRYLKEVILNVFDVSISQDLKLHVILTRNLVLVPLMNYTMELIRKQWY